MKEIGFNKFILFWLSQSISQLGSAMTSFALIIWVYKETNSALAVSLISFSTYLPMVITSLFCGAFIDLHSKKKIMLVSDTVAVIGTCILWYFISNNSLNLGLVYIINGVTGFMNAFQIPASSVVVGILVPKDRYDKASGMNSLSNSLITVVMPMLATSVTAFWGLKTVLVIDMISFLTAFTILAGFIEIKEEEMSDSEAGFIRNARSGIAFLKGEKGIIYLIISMALLNFFSNITYENILPSMILARSGGDEITLGIVSGVLGIGGIIGGLIVSTISLKGDKIKIIYGSAAISFLLGDLLMGVGNHLLIWSVAALAASLPIPFVTAGQNMILYQKVPQTMQGRVFAVRNGIQYGTIPAGILLGGMLADYIFEPWMMSGNIPIFSSILGDEKGSGMALMFVFTSVLGFLSSVYWYRNKKVRSLCEKNSVVSRRDLGE